MLTSKDILRKLPDNAMQVVNSAAENPDFFLLVRNEINAFFMEPRNCVRLEPLNEPEKSQVANDLMLGLIQKAEVKNKINTPFSRVKLALNSLQIDKTKVDVWTLTLKQIINKLPKDPKFQQLFENVQREAKRSGTEGNLLMIAFDMFKDNLANLNFQESAN